ncbi:MAG: hypothetical protein WHT63_05680, partial [Tepidiforma sp.]
MQETEANDLIPTTDTHASENGHAPEAPATRRRAARTRKADPPPEVLEQAIDVAAAAGDGAGSTRAESAGEPAEGPSPRRRVRSRASAATAEEQGAGETRAQDAKDSSEAVPAASPAAPAAEERA